MRRILDTPPSLLQSLDDSYALCAGCRYNLEHFNSYNGYYMAAAQTASSHPGAAHLQSLNIYTHGGYVRADDNQEEPGHYFFPATTYINLLWLLISAVKNSTVPREPSAWKKPAGGGAGQMSAGAGAGVGDVDAQRVTAADRSSRASGLIGAAVGAARCQLAARREC